MDKWDQHEAFIRAAETGSLSRAAHDLRMTQPAVSKRIERLEKDVGARLLERSSTGIRLTDAGAQYLDVVRKVRSELEEAETALTEDRTGVSGVLRLSFPVAFGETWLTKLALRFHQTHPCVGLDISLNDRVVDLVEDGIDVAFRLGTNLSPTLIARPVGNCGFVLAATPKYLSKYGVPKGFDALLDRPFFAYFRGEERFTLPSGEEKVMVPKHRIRLTNSRAILTAVLEDAGIARVAQWAVDEHLRDGRLVQVLPELRMERMSAYAVYLPSRYVPERVRKFVAFLVAEVPKIPGWAAPPTRSS
jgi:DNA-binding transcriptional LysR family regulator